MIELDGTEERCTGKPVWSAEAKPMADVCERCGVAKPLSVTWLWACCGDGPGLMGQIKQETLDCKNRQLEQHRDRIRAIESELAELRKREESRSALWDKVDALAERILNEPQPEPEHRDDGKSGEGASER